MQFLSVGCQIPPAMVLGLWELAETSEVAEICIRGALSNAKLVDEENNCKKYLRTLHP